MKTAGPKLLLISDAPGTATGLGGQSRIVFEAAVAAGYQVVVANLVVMEGARSPFPRFYHASGMVPEYLVSVPLQPDHLGYILTEYKPDLIVALCDAWMLGPFQMQPRDVVAKTILWTTADHEFFPEVFKPLYDRVKSLVFMSEFGQRWWGPGLKREAPAVLIPHAVDGDCFKPRDPAMFTHQRAQFGTTGHFIALHVGRNQHRKQQPLLIEGWARFVRMLEPEVRKQVTLYLHTEEQVQPSPPIGGDSIFNLLMALEAGINLPRFIAKNYSEEIARTIRFSARNVPREGVAMMYSLADVCVLTSLGEGFGVPLVEAQASGKANISADNTTTPEIVGGVGATVVDSAVTMLEGETEPMRAPFGWRVPCNSFSVQPDFSGKRPMVDCGKLAEALRDAYVQWRLGNLNAPEMMIKRRDWTLRRYGWGLIRQRWIDLLKGAMA